MTEATRIRAQLDGDGADVRMRMAHEMESGQRRDADGNIIPAWHIVQVTVRLGERPVLKASWGPAVSKNPYLQFRVPGARAGDRIVVSWEDTRGATREDMAVVAEGGR